MKKILYLILILLTFISPLKSSARKLISDSTVIDINLVDLKIESTGAIIKVQISKYPFGGEEYFKSVDTTYEQKYISGQTNTFNVTAPAEIFYMFIFIQGVKETNGLFDWIDNVYIIKAGSNLSVAIYSNDIEFRGRGSFIPNIQSKLIKVAYVQKTSDLDLFNSKQYQQYLTKLDESLDSTMELQLKIIDDNKHFLGKEATDMLITNSIGYRYFSQLRSYLFFQDPLFLNSMKNYYSGERRHLTKAKFKNRVLNEAPLYANYIIEELNIRERMKYPTYLGILPDSSINNIINNIERDYEGIFKDKLLTLFILRFSKNPKALTYLDKISSIVKDQGYKNLLLKIRLTHGYGLPFKDFSLTDSNGTVYNLAKFKDKVVLIDFWYSGCVNCIRLTDFMKPVYEHFANNKKIVFASVSIDKNKGEWINSLKGGLYTHQEGINLYTNG